MQTKSLDLFSDLSENEKDQARLKGEIAAHIQNKRNERNMTESEFAKYIGISTKLLRKLELEDD